MSTQGQGDVADNAAYLREWAADIRKSNGKSVDADRLDSIAAEIDDLKRAARNRDMWKGQCERQADELTRLRTLLSSSRGEQDDLEPGELRPCPFCGARAEVVHFEGPECSEDDDNFGGSCVQCTCCQASSAVVFGYKETLYSGWNERAVLPSAPGPVPTSLAGQGTDGTEGDADLCDDCGSALGPGEGGDHGEPNRCDACNVTRREIDRPVTDPTDGGADV